MTNEEVRSFFHKELSENPLRRAYVATRKQIGIDLLNKHLDSSLDPELRQLVIDANDAMSRTSLFSSQWMSILNIEEDLVFIYSQCEKVLQYLLNTYDSLPKDAIRKCWEKENLSQCLESVAEIIKKCEKVPKIGQGAIVKIKVEIIEHAERLLPWIYILALDETTIEMIAKESDRQYKILKNEHDIVVKIRKFGDNTLSGGNA